MTKPSERIHPGVTQCNYTLASIRYILGGKCCTFQLITKCNSPGSQVHKCKVYKKQKCIRKQWAKGIRNWDRLSVCRWWILALHVLLLPESGCEIYGPYKGSSSCGWQTVYNLQDRRSWLLLPREIATEISLNHHAGNLSACGLVCRPQSFGLGMKLQYVCSVVFVFSFPTPSPPSPYLYPGWCVWIPSTVIQNALTRTSLHEYIRQGVCHLSCYSI